MSDMEIKLGSEDFPILLVNHTSDKVEDESSGSKKKNRNGVYWPRKKILDSPFNREFTSVKNGADINNAFILNVIQNPDLSAFEMRLALYFYYKEMEISPVLGDGRTYLVDEPHVKKDLKKLIGEDGTLHYSTNGLDIDEIDDFIVLIDDLKKSNMETTLLDLNAAIQTLSDYAYITITPISWEFAHVRSSRAAKGKVNEAGLNHVYARNIRVFSRMSDKLIFRTIKKEEVK
jgi:hypothetical protein